jgi:hypothetical protein
VGRCKCEEIADRHVAHKCAVEAAEPEASEEHVLPHEAIVCRWVFMCVCIYGCESGCVCDVVRTAVSLPCYSHTHALSLCMCACVPVSVRASLSVVSLYVTTVVCVGGCKVCKQC